MFKNRDEEILEQLSDIQSRLDKIDNKLGFLTNYLDVDGALEDWRRLDGKDPGLAGFRDRTNTEIQKFMRMVENDTLAAALTAEKPEVVALFLDNMANRGAAIFAEDIEEMKPVDPDTLKKAQQDIGVLIIRMIRQGEISENDPTDVDE